MIKRYRIIDGRHTLKLVRRKRPLIRVRSDSGIVSAPSHAMPVNEVLYLPLDYRITSKNRVGHNA